MRDDTTVDARAVKLLPCAGVSSADMIRARGVVAAHRTLGDVLAWTHASRPVRTIAAIVTQDEYTHDVIVALDERLWLAYDTT